MLHVATARLAIAVSAAGGLGFVPGGYYFESSSVHSTKMSQYLQEAREEFSDNITLFDESILPIGVGLITCRSLSHIYFVSDVLPLLHEYRPCSVWLFAPDPVTPSIHAEIINSIRSHYTSSTDSINAWHKWTRHVKIWIQVGTVAAARQAVRDGADVVVAQGVDAGGHQFATGSGTMGLVAEVVDVVAEESEKTGRSGQVAVIAAGGIADGRGVVAALGLGSSGAVMGTRVRICNLDDTFCLAVW